MIAISYAKLYLIKIWRGKCNLSVKTGRDGETSFYASVRIGLMGRSFILCFLNYAIPVSKRLISEAATGVFYKKSWSWKFRSMHRKTPVGGESLQLYQKATPAKVFSCEYCGIFKNTYFEKYLRKVSESFLQWGLLIALKFYAVTESTLFILGNCHRIVFRTLSNIL